jgi:hypothetical protein
VGTRTLALSCRFLNATLRYQTSFKQLSPAFETILFKVSLPLLVVSERDYSSFFYDPVEYVRLQSDTNEFNVKRQLSNLIEQICTFLNCDKRKSK